MLKLKIGSAVIALSLLLLVFYENSEPAKFWFFGEIWISKTVLIVVSALIGAFVTLGVQWILRRSKSPSAESNPAMLRADPPPPPIL